jgi:adenine phosphoribosyltransferase
MPTPGLPCSQLKNPAFPAPQQPQEAFVSLQEIVGAIRDVPDFPKPGIIFKDISPILGNGRLFKETIDLMGARYVNRKVDMILAIDARGFIFGSALAYKLGCGIQMVRKRGKLPFTTEKVAYDLEYGSNEIEIHVDSVSVGDQLILVDDVLATGGTAKAAADLVQRLGGNIIGAEFFIELGFLDGRKKLPGVTVHSLIRID